MIRQVINVDNKWKVIVYYNIDYNLFHYVADELRGVGMKERGIQRIAYLSFTGEVKAFTVSDCVRRISIVGFNNHKTVGDYINSIVHEAEHVKQAMLKSYNVEDEGEPPAYTIGFLVMKMMKVFKKVIQNNLFR